MIIQFHKQAEKELKKMNVKNKKFVLDALKLFLENPYHPKLNNHELKGKEKIYRSINATGDLRIIYSIYKGGVVIVKKIGTHSKLYK